MSFKQLILSICLFIIVFILFYPCLNNSFIYMDDGKYILENENIQHGLNLTSIKWALTSFECANWHPFTWFSHILDYMIYQDNPKGHHLSNIFLHSLNSVLLFICISLILSTYLKDKFNYNNKILTISFILSFLFAIHPLRVESVNWISERKDLLCATFWFISTIFYLFYIQNKTVKNYLLMFFAFFLGTMSKPMIVTFPLTLILLDLFLLKRGNNTKEILFEKIPLFAMTFFLSVITLLAQSQGNAIIDTETIPLFNRILNSIMAYYQYLFLFFNPSKLAIFYPYSLTISVKEIFLSISVLLTISVYCIKNRITAPHLLFGWLWYLGTLVPVIGLIQVGEQSLADRYTYIPNIGISIIFISAIIKVASKFIRFKYFRIVLFIGVISFLMTLTRIQISFWNNPISLYTHAISITNNNYLAHNNLGIEYFNQGNSKDAINHINKAIELKPDKYKYYYNLAVVYHRQKDFDRAIQLYKIAIAKKSDYSKTYYNLGNLYLEMQKYTEAIKYFSIGLTQTPDSVELHNNIALAYYNIKDYKSAINHLEKILEINPDFKLARNNLNQIISEVSDI